MTEIPLASGAANAHQKFSVRLGENLLDFEVNYITYLETPAWSMDIYRDGSPMALGAMLEPGLDIIAGYDAQIGSFYLIGSEVTLDNLGIDNHLVWAET